MAGYSASYSDASQSAASLTAGAKFSGINMAGPLQTPPFLNNLFSSAAGAAQVAPAGISVGTIAAAVAVAVAAVLLLRNKGR